MDPSARVDRGQLRHHEAAVRRQLQLVDARHHLVALLRVEMNAVSVEQFCGRGGVAFGLDALNFGKQLADTVAEGRGIDHHQVGLAVAGALLDRLGVGHQPAHDHLAVAHVIFFDLRAFADAPQLDQRVARVGFVLRLDDVVVIGGGDDADLDQLRIGDEIETDQVGAAFLERGEVLLDQRLRIALAVRLAARRVADHFVHVGGQLAAEGAELPRALGFIGRPRKLAAHRPRRRLVVGLVDVGEGHRLAAVLLADRLVVGQVDADGRDRAGVAGLDDHVDRVGDNALDARLAVLRIPRHAILEPLRVGGERLDALRLFLVDVEDQAFPAALDAARIEVDLDEAVDGVDR